MLKVLQTRVQDLFSPMEDFSLDKLKSDGWVRRFTASGSRLQEAIENYRMLGYEVKTIPLNRLSFNGCTVCLEDENDDTVMIFTRRSSAQSGDAIDDGDE